MPSPGYVQLNISVPEKIKDELKRLCNDAGVSLSQAIQDFTNACVAENRLITTHYRYPAPIKDEMTDLHENISEMKQAIASLTKEVATIKKQ